MTSLIVDSVRFSYSPGVEVVRGVSFALEAKSATAVVGPNGSGKSTLFRVITDLLQLRSGSVQIAGHANATRAAKLSTMYLAGNDYVPEFLTGLEYLKFMAGLYGEQLSVDEVSALFARYGMTGRERNLIEDYSHGMRKKVQLVAALLLRRAVTIIDETLNGIDLDAQFAFEEDISLLTQRGGSLLLCSHDFGLLQRTCSRVLFLHHGTLAVDDTLTAVDTEYGSLEQMVRDVLTAR